MILDMEINLDKWEPKQSIRKMIGMLFRED